MLFGASSKIHEPAKHLAQLTKRPDIPSTIQRQLIEILPDFLSLGLEEHLMTDYGDESSYKLPWDLFDEESAILAVDAARICKKASEEIVRQSRKSRFEK